MSVHGNDLPSLEDALASGFAELKIGESKINTSEPINEQPIDNSDQEIQPTSASEPKYGYKIDAVEPRQSFVVKPNSATLETKGGLEITSPAEEERIAQEKARLEAEAFAQQPQKPQQEVKDKPSSTIGDEFDVAW
jgi:hypothetical protein